MRALIVLLAVLAAVPGAAGLEHEAPEDEELPQEALGPYGPVNLAVIGAALAVLGALVGIAWWRTRHER